MKKVCLFILLAVAYHIVYGQFEVEAYIRDSNNDVVPFANISIKNKPIGTCSNENGYFDFIIDSAYYKDTIVISCIGYNNYYFIPQNIRKSDSIFICKLQNTA